MQSNDGLPVAIPRTFEPLSGNPANLTCSGSNQAVTLTQIIPPKGCNVRIVTTGGNVRMRFDGAAASATVDMLLLAGTVEVFTLSNNQASLTAILDSASASGAVNVTLGYGA